MQIVEASGLEALALVTDLLHRVRLADPYAGVWEAADVQWWWRSPRPSDSLPQRFWLDRRGPLAAAILTDWRHTWGVDPIGAPEAGVALQQDILFDALARLKTFAAGEAAAPTRLETLVRDDDVRTIALLGVAGFQRTEDRGGITWLDADRRPPIPRLADGFQVVDRATRPDRPHPISRRSGDDAEERLRQVSLYDPSLDLAIETITGEIAGYALFWSDPITRVGLVEPMRVEDRWQRRGLGRILLTTGIERLVDRGATRVKVGWGSEPGRQLYLSAGFVEQATTTNYARSLE
jgi:predicted N-acetyltransferase YhbS